MSINPPPSVTVHLLHDNTLTQDNRDKFIYLAGRYNQIIKFYNVEEICVDKIANFKKRIPTVIKNKVTIGSLYRLIIADLISEDIQKIIYLDSDVIINLDINELWQTELKDMPLAAVPLVANRPHMKDSAAVADVEKAFAICRYGAVNPEDYFNAGIILMNLNRLRKERGTIELGIKFYADNLQKFTCFDQDILNYCFSKNYLKLPINFNLAVEFSRVRGDSQTNQRICHYVCHAWNIDMNDAFNRLWLKYFVKTPWFNEDAIGNVFNDVKELYAEQKNLMQNISAAMSGKVRAFVTAPQNIDALKQIFYAQEGEEFFKIDSPNWFENLVTTMKNSVGKKIFFMMTGGIYPQLRATLMQIGFVEWRDFLNAEIFLSDIQGVTFDSYKLIEKM